MPPSAGAGTHRDYDCDYVSHLCFCTRSYVQWGLFIMCFTDLFHQSTTSHDKTQVFPSPHHLCILPSTNGVWISDGSVGFCFVQLRMFVQVLSVHLLVVFAVFLNLLLAVCSLLCALFFLFLQPFRLLAVSQWALVYSWPRIVSCL